MSRIILVALLAIVGTLAVVGTAGADIGDIDGGELSEGPLESDDDNVTIEGTVVCEEDDLEYGVIVKVSNDDGQNLSSDSEIFTDSPEDNSTIEGVGAFGPAFEGVQDDQPCDENTADYDVTVATNDGSQELVSGEELDAAALVGTTSNGGANGPGPIVGDIEFFSDNDALVE